MLLRHFQAWRRANKKIKSDKTATKRLVKKPVKVFKTFSGISVEDLKAKSTATSMSTPTSYSSHTYVASSHVPRFAFYVSIPSYAFFFRSMLPLFTTLFSFPGDVRKAAAEAADRAKKAKAAPKAATAVKGGKAAAKPKTAAKPKEFTKVPKLTRQRTAAIAGRK